MKMIWCLWYRLTAGRRFEGHLSDSSAARSHSRQCRQCREAVLAANEVERRLNKPARQITPPEDFHSRLMRRLQNEKAPTLTPARAFYPLAMAAAALLAFGIWFSVHSLAQRSAGPAGEKHPVRALEASLPFTPDLHHLTERAEALAVVALDRELEYLKEDLTAATGHLLAGL